MAKGVDKGAVPPDDPMFSGGARLHSPMPSSELRKPFQSDPPRVPSELTEAPSSTSPVVNGPNDNLNPVA